MAKVSKQNIHTCSELEYRRKWLYQLQSEFKQICSWYRIALAVPSFRISESPATLGSWHPESRTISISSTLINEYSWDAVINVLKHEMAHQYVHEYMGRGMELPHGQAFADACNKLGVLSPFNAATGDTPKVFIATTTALSVNTTLKGSIVLSHRNTAMKLSTPGRRDCISLCAG